MQEKISERPCPQNHQERKRAEIEYLEEQISAYGTKIQQLEDDIAREVSRSRCADPTDSRYSVLAAQMRTRQENLKSTLHTLSTYLCTLESSEDTGVHARNTDH